MFQNCEQRSSNKYVLLSMTICIILSVDCPCFNLLKQDNEHKI